MWGAASIIYSWNFVAVYIYFERTFCILVINSCCLWILLVRFQVNFIIVVNSVWFGNSYFPLYTCVCQGGSLFILGVFLFISVWLNFYLFLLGIHCHFWVGLPTSDRCMHMIDFIFSIYILLYMYYDISLYFCGCPTSRIPYDHITCSLVPPENIIQQPLLCDTHIHLESINN